MGTVCSCGMVKVVEPTVLKIPMPVLEEDEFKLIVEGESPLISPIKSTRKPRWTAEPVPICPASPLSYPMGE